MKDDGSLVKGNNYANRESFHEGESREEDEIGWEAMTLPVKETQGNEASKHGNVEDPYAAEARWRTSGSQSKQVGVKVPIVRTDTEPRRLHWCFETKYRSRYRYQATFNEIRVNIGPLPAI